LGFLAAIKIWLWIMSVRWQTPKVSAAPSNLVQSARVILMSLVLVVFSTAMLLCKAI
jgi:hypothetical protein